jgi:hypothetical protein
MRVIDAKIDESFERCDWRHSVMVTPIVQSRTAAVLCGCLWLALTLAGFASEASPPGACQEARRARSPAPIHKTGCCIWRGRTLPQNESARIHEPFSHLLHRGADAADHGSSGRVQLVVKARAGQGTTTRSPEESALFHRRRPERQRARSRDPHPRSPAGILGFQKAYVRRVIDMINDLDNVLHERKHPDWQMRKVTR